MKAKTPAARREKHGLNDDIAATYEAFKEFEGRRYTGMRVGRGHKWNYDPGIWTEKKVTPDRWEIHYAVTKRRVGRAPEGSGVPVGTGYHWYILAHQNVRKLNANDYTTSMTGLKFKIAHKRGGTEKWSVSDKGQRKRMIGFLRGVLEDLEEQQQQGEATRKKPVAKAQGEKNPTKAPAKPTLTKKPGKVTPKSMTEPKRPRRKTKA